MFALVDGNNFYVSCELMATLDRINDRFGRGTIGLASAGVSRSERRWSMRQQLRTPAYTTSWNDLPVARA